MRKSLFVFTVFFLIVTFTFENVHPVFSTEPNTLSGTGYGNNGERFGSFMSCSDADSVHYFKGSTIHFKTALDDYYETDNKNSDTPIGSWTIDFIVDDLQSPMRIGGDINEFKINNNTYALVGKETFDNVCNDIGNTITLVGECGENTRISFVDSNNEKIGSLTPPNGDKSHYLKGSNVDCA